MPSKLANLQAKAEKASTTKNKLNMDPTQAMRLREDLLKISNLAIAAFDVLDSGMVSQFDVIQMAMLPEYINRFSQGIQQHANNTVEAARRQR